MSRSWGWWWCLLVASPLWPQDGANAQTIACRAPGRRKKGPHRGFLLVLSLPKWKEKWRLFAEFLGNFNTRPFLGTERTRSALVSRDRAAELWVCTSGANRTFIYVFNVFIFLFVALLIEKDVGESYWLGCGPCLPEGLRRHRMSNVWAKADSERWFFLPLIITHSLQWLRNRIWTKFPANQRLDEYRD